MKLAFLRGFYDGDGNSGETRIQNTNKEFLEQIKIELKIKYSVRKRRGSYIKIDENGKLHKYKDYWALNLGARIFNEMSSVCMLKNLGLERKNKEFSEHHEALDILKEKIGTKENLEELVLKFRQYELIKMFSTSAETFRKLREEWDVELPLKWYCT